MILLSQKDPRWGGLKINGTQYSMAGWGCFVTACSMVAGIEPPEALKKLKFDGAMLIWESIKNIGLEPLYKGDWDNAKALEYVATNGQCIARVDFDGSDRTDDTHFVVLIGNKRLYDPIDGKEKPTSAYSKYTGIRACRKVNMTSDEMIIKKSDFENLVTKATKLDEILAKYQVADPQALYNMVAGLQARTTDLGNQLGTAQAEMKNREEQVGRLVIEIANLKSDYEALMDRFNIATGNYETAVKEKASLAIEVAQLKTQLESAKQGDFTLTIADLFKLIWNQKITITKG